MHTEWPVKTGAARYDERKLNKKKAVYCLTSYEGNPECFKPGNAILRFLLEEDHSGCCRENRNSEARMEAERSVWRVVRNDGDRAINKDGDTCKDYVKADLMNIFIGKMLYIRCSEKNHGKK